MTGYIILTRKKGTKTFTKAGPYVFSTRKEALMRARQGLGEEWVYYDVTTRKVRSHPNG